eukprot:5057122-Alexandrium_andersonii.AAC.1
MKAVLMTRKLSRPLVVSNINAGSAGAVVAAAWSWQLRKQSRLRCMPQRSRLACPERPPDGAHPA